MKRVIRPDELVVVPEELRDPSFAAAVITWQKEFGRHSLPWQQTRDAYRVWLSEIMLQQTQVTAVIPYYHRFLDRCPTVFDLAKASSEEVMALWSGLGYYTRARNLHRCAKQVVEQYHGKFPSDPKLLQELPGIGRSTAAAIAAFSYGTQAAILDGNVKRVFARVFGVEGYPGAKAIEDQLWLRAQALLPEQNIESYTQGLMDLGATLCTRSSPSCPRCPLRTKCVAYRDQRTSELPYKKPKSAIKEKQALMFLLRHQDKVLLEKRPDSGIWGGLLSLPEYQGMQLRQQSAQLEEQQIFDVASKFAQQYGNIQELTVLPEMTHVFTHFRLSFKVVYVRIDPLWQSIQENATNWLAIRDSHQAALPAPIKSLLLRLAAELET